MSDSIRTQLTDLQQELVRLREQRQQAMNARGAGAAGDVPGLDIRIQRVEQLAASLLRALDVRQSVEKETSVASEAAGAAASARRSRESPKGSAPEVGRKRRVRDEDDDESVRFAKRRLLQIDLAKSVRVQRYTADDFAAAKDMYEKYYLQLIPQQYKEFLLAQGGPVPTLRDQFVFIGQLLDEMRARNIARGPDAVHEIIGNDLAKTIVVLRIILHNKQVDGESITNEHILALINELANASPSYQLTSMRYWSPFYFEEAIRALRRGESAQDASNYLLLGGAVAA